MDAGPASQVQDIKEQVLEQSETFTPETIDIWSEEDEQDLLAFSMKYAGVIYPEEADLCDEQDTEVY
jgi:hypothetical protein